jgi:NifB/MoaA-like Fe-S oxidoreductase
LARAYVAQAEAWGERFTAALGERFVYPADELFLLAGAALPPVEYYGAFPQLENGIGMVRTFLDAWDGGRGRLPGRLRAPSRLGLVTGRLASRFLAPMAAELSGIGGLQVDLLVVDNDYFGRGIGVSGLLTGRDILARVRGGGPWDRILLPPNCINGEGLTLDDMTVAGLEQAVGAPVSVGSYDLAGTVLEALGQRRRRRSGAGRQLSELGCHVGRGR